jgi:Uncharacterized protein containing double-stranded beta helix domain
LLRFNRIAWLAPLVLTLAACGGPAASSQSGVSSIQQAASGESGSSSSSGQFFAYITQARFQDDGTIPNNPKYPVLIYHGAVKGKDADQIIGVFKENNWGNNWIDGIFDFHHFHSTAHEVLGIAAGHGEVQLGGAKGKTFKVSAGDVVVLPAGTGHKRISASGDFSVVGGYPGGQSYDTQTKETAQLKKTIANVGKPAEDPVYGNRGPLLKLWKD